MSHAALATDSPRLLGRVGCHLCAEAIEQLVAADVVARWVDIDEDVVLAVDYALTIPVLQRADGAELCWPFTSTDICKFLGTRRQ